MTDDALALPDPDADADRVAPLTGTAPDHPVADAPGTEAADPAVEPLDDPPADPPPSDAGSDPDEAAALDALVREEARELDRLAREWEAGEGWATNIGHGRAFVDRFGDDVARRLLEAHGLGDHPAVLRVAAAAGRHIADLERELAELRGETPAPPAADGAPPALSDRRRRELEDEHRRLRRGADYWTDGSARRRVREIMEALHGTRPIRAPLAVGAAADAR